MKNVQIHWNSLLTEQEVGLEAVGYVGVALIRGGVARVRAKGAFYDIDPLPACFSPRVAIEPVLEGEDDYQTGEKTKNW